MQTTVETKEKHRSDVLMCFSKHSFYSLLKHKEKKRKKKKRRFDEHDQS